MTRKSRKNKYKNSDEFYEYDYDNNGDVIISNKTAVYNDIKKRLNIKNRYDAINCYDNRKNTFEEFADKENVEITIKICYEGVKYSIYDRYYLAAKYKCGTGQFKDCYYCNRECKCGLEHKIDEKYHKYDETTGIWRHIKRLPDIDAHINCKVKNDTVQNITSKKYYILDDKFYWKYAYNNNKWLIKFYPNLHDDKRYLTDKICEKCSNINLSKDKLITKTYELFYFVSKLPIDIKNVILKYL
jgi:hypothetical protein